MVFAPHPLNTARATSALWKFRLRRSVRLLLALGEPWAQALEVEARLRLVERQLLQHLLQPQAGQLALEPSPPEAHAIVELAQSTLLGSEAMVRAILTEFSVLRAVHPVRNASPRRRR